MIRVSLFIAAVCCLELVTYAQVSNTTEPPPKAPSYTPEELFGPLSPSGSSPSSEPNRDTSSPQLLTPPPQQPSLPPRPTVTQPPARQPACPPSASASPNASPFPGVSASQLPRAGVSADAFARPGVSAEQLRTLIPGNQAEACPSTRDPVLNPDPVNPPRRIPAATDEQQGP